MKKKNGASQPRRHESETVDLANTSNRRELAKLYLDAARDAWEDGESDEADDTFRQALDYDPDAVDALAAYARFLMEAERFSESSRLLVRAVKLDESRAELYTIRGGIKRCQGEYAASIADYDRALRLDPSDYLALYGRGISHDMLGHSRQALDDLSECLRIAPEFVAGWYDRGVLLTAENDLDAAISDYTRAIELEPDFVQAYITRGDLFSVQRKYENAIADFNKAIELAPDDPDAYYYRSLVWTEIGDSSAAHRDYHAAVKRGLSEE